MPVRSPDLLSRVLPLAAALLLCAGGLSGQSRSDRPLVVIDAGHGGADPGAIGPSGVREKDVTLAIARDLARLLRADPGIEVRMTRDRDTLIALRDRPTLANRWRGGTPGHARPALFISVHANAHRDPGARGFETYFLSEAVTEDARRVAAMENAAERFEGRAARASALSFILDDLRRNLHLRESAAWAETVQHRLAAVHPGPARGVKQAGFLVLDGARMPAVLVEVGFITNRSEERLLTERSTQLALADTLAAAITEFFARGSR